MSWRVGGAEDPPLLLGRKSLLVLADLARPIHLLRCLVASASRLLLT